MVAVSKEKALICLSKDYISLFFFMGYGLSYRDKVQCFSSFRLLLHQNVAHGFDMLVAIISPKLSFIATSVRAIMPSSGTKTDSGIRSTAVILFITNDTDSSFGAMFMQWTHKVEPFFVTIWLQGCRRTEQRLPRVATQWGVAVITISNQWVQGVGVLGDDNESCLMSNFHTETDLGERCVPVGW